MTDDSTATLATTGLKLDASYKGDALTQRLTEILGLDSPVGWSVVDTPLTEGDDLPTLAMVHYNDDCQISDSLASMRGQVFAVASGDLVAPSFGYTPACTADTLTVEEEEIVISDKDGVEHRFPTAATEITPAFSGVLIRVYRTGGQTHYSTNRKINPRARRSRWKKKAFMEMFDEAGGPTEDQLFDLSKPESDTCYVFMVVHPELLVATRQRVLQPYVVHLASFKTVRTCAADDVGSKQPTFTVSDTIGGVMGKPGIYKAKTMTIEEANHHLAFGYYQSFETAEPRLATGEALILCHYEPGNRNNVLDIVIVHSSSYEWRDKMRGGNPNLEHQFYSLLDVVKGNDCEAWPLVLLPLYGEAAVKKMWEDTAGAGLLTFPMVPINKRDYESKAARLELLWMNFVVSLPVNQQEEALGLLARLAADREALLAWLLKIGAAYPDISSADFSERVKALISISRQSAQNTLRSGKAMGPDGRPRSRVALIKTSLRNLIYKEQGGSLYKLIREMKRQQEQGVTIPEPAHRPATRGRGRK